MSNSTEGQVDRKNRETTRLRAIKRILAGESPEFIATVFKVHRSSIYNWLKRYREGDFTALKSRPITGRPRKLAEDQERLLFKTIVTRNPLRLRLDDALWNHEMVQQYIMDTFNVTFSNVQVGRLLKSFGISCDKPLTRIARRNLWRMNKWLAQDYPDIKEKAKDEKGDIYFIEMKELHPTPKVAKGLKGVLQSKAHAARKKLYLFSAVTSRGSMRFMISRGKPTPARFVAFLERLLHGAQNPVYVIGEGKPYEWHQRVRFFLKSTQGKLKLYYLPLYMPDVPADAGEFLA